MQSDNQGFLTGGIAMGLIPGQVDDELADALVGVRRDTSHILALMRKHMIAVPTPACAAPMRRTGSDPVAKAVTRLVSEQARQRQQPTAVVQPAYARPRDERGRFTKVPTAGDAGAIGEERGGASQPRRPAEQTAGMATGSGSFPGQESQATQAVREAAATMATEAKRSREDRRQDRMEDRRRDGNGRFSAGGAGSDGSGDVGKLSALGSAAGEAASNALSQSSGLDPALAAAQELRGMVVAVKDVASPVVRGISSLTGLGASQEKQQTGWLKRIAQALGWQRRDTKTQSEKQARALRDVAKAAGQEKSSSWLMALLPMLLTRLPALLTVTALPAIFKWLGAFPGMRLLARAPVVGPALTALWAWMSDADIRADPSLSEQERRKARAENAGSAIGALVGGFSGMVLGGPIGAAVGAWLGSEGGKQLGEPLLKVYDFIAGLSVWDKLDDFFSDARTYWGQLYDWGAGLMGGKRRGAAAPGAPPPAQSAGAPTPGSVDALTAQMESGGNPNAVGNAKGDPGGPSYGLYQLSTNTGTLAAFLAQTKYGRDFKGLEPGTPEFKKRWQEVQARDPDNFQFAQLDFIRKNNVIPAGNALKAAGIDLSGRGRAVQEMLFSTATQFGPGSIDSGKGAVSLIKNALSGMSLPGMSDADIVTAVQRYKLANNASLFRSSSADVQAVTANRAIKEHAALLRVAGAAAGASAPPATVTPNIPGLSVPPARSATPVVVPAPQEPASQPQRINSPAAPVIVVPPASAPVGQNVPDRGIAHVVSGGIGWRPL